MKICVVSMFCLILFGCSTAPVSDNRASYDNSKRIALRQSADNGDKDAQYELGNAYCCGESGYWSTKEAIKWWCKSASQGKEKAAEAVSRRGATCNSVY